MKSLPIKRERVNCEIEVLLLITLLSYSLHVVPSYFSFFIFVLCISYFNAIMAQVLFCSTENGRTSFVRQLEPDWHIDTNPDIIFQLAVNFYFLFKDIKTHIVHCTMYGCITIVFG